MNRELQQVRRYWPKAKMSCQLLADGAVVWTAYGTDRIRPPQICVYADGRATVGGWPLSNKPQPTIAEAMRAAGFVARPLGKHARERVKRAEYRQQLIGYAALGPSWAAGAARLLAYYQPRLADRQRPRKGARLGRRKRTGWDKEETRRFAQWREWESPKMTANDTPKWYAVAATYPRYELRHGAEVLTVVRYSPSDGMWTAPRTGGFHTAEGAMRWEEMRLRVPACPVAEVQP